MAETSSRSLGDRRRSWSSRRMRGCMPRHLPAFVVICRSSVPAPRLWRRRRSRSPRGLGRPVALASEPVVRAWSATRRAGGRRRRGPRDRHDAGGGPERRPRPVHLSLLAPASTSSARRATGYCLDVPRAGAGARRTSRSSANITLTRLATAARLRPRSDRRGWRCRRACRSRQHTETGLAAASSAAHGAARRASRADAGGDRRSAGRGRRRAKARSSTGSSRARLARPRRFSSTPISAARSTSSTIESCRGDLGERPCRLAARHRVRRRSARRWDGTATGGSRQPWRPATCRRGRCWATIETRASRAHAFRAGRLLQHAGVLTAGRASLRSPRPARAASAASTAVDRWRRRPALDARLRPAARSLRLPRRRRTLVSPRVGARVAASPRATRHGGRVATHGRARRRRVPAAVGRRACGCRRSGRSPPCRRARRSTPRAIGQHERRPRARARSRPTPAVSAVQPVLAVGRSTRSRRCSGSMPTSEVGHYYVATPATSACSGWRVGLAGESRTACHRAASTTRSGQARWREPRRVRPAAPCCRRWSGRGVERLHDVTRSLDASCLRSATRVTVAYRLNTALLSDDRPRIAPAAGGRFDVEIRQALPYQPIRGGKLELALRVARSSRDIIDHGVVL